MKFRSGQVLDILRQFSLASTDDVPRLVENIKVTMPTPAVTAVSLKFHDSRYIVVVDNDADDDEAQLRDLISKIEPGADGKFIANPNSETATFAVPFEGKAVYLFHLTRDEMRLDSILARDYPEYSRSSWQTMIKRGYVLVNDKAITSPSKRFLPGDKITINIPEAADHSDSELPIIYMDEDVIVIDKPAGVLTHAKNPLDDEFTVASFIQRYLSSDFTGNRPGIVHRLDRDTSGVIITARTPAAHEFLKAQFANRSVIKVYQAVTDGIPKQPKARIDIPIARNMAQPGSFTGKADGKPAVTDIATLRTGLKHALVEARPRTGRTHQIRVHLAQLGTPVHGDRLYGKPADRLYLHAHQLSLELPGKHDQQTFTSPVPTEFAEVVDA